MRFFLRVLLPGRTAPTSVRSATTNGTGEINNAEDVTLAQHLTMLTTTASVWCVASLTERVQGRMQEMPRQNSRVRLRGMRDRVVSAVAGRQREEVRAFGL